MVISSTVVADDAMVDDPVVAGWIRAGLNAHVAPFADLRGGASGAADRCLV